MRRRKPAPPVKSRGNLTHNSQQNGSRFAGVLVTPREYTDAMAAYDALPPRMRRELRRAPYNVDPVGAKEYVQRAGEAAALQVLQNSLSIGLTKSRRETGLTTGVCRD